MTYVVFLILTLFLYMTGWFCISLLRKRNDVADVAWGIGFVRLAWTALGTAPSPEGRGVWIAALVTIWGVRLAWHIHRRNRGKTEDYRYLAWRKAWGQWFYIRSYLQVYVLQGALLFTIALPILLVNAQPGSDFGVLDILGTCVWGAGFLFEAVGDAQLARFIRNPANAGKLMQSGLWSYTRHPNYFGEITQWWGIWLIALAAPYGWIGILGPITITVLIVFVSGIPLLEEKMAKHPDFAQYKARVSMLIPLPKRRV